MKFWDALGVAHVQPVAGQDGPAAGSCRELPGAVAAGPWLLCQTAGARAVFLVKMGGKGKNKH